MQRQDHTTCSNLFDTSLGANRYKHWGLVGPLNDTSEPDNFRFPELCAAANWSEAYGRPLAWGWADTHCQNKLPALCRQQSESPAFLVTCVLACLPACLLPSAAAASIGTMRHVTMCSAPYHDAARTDAASLEASPSFNMSAVLTAYHRLRLQPLAPSSATPAPPPT